MAVAYLHQVHGHTAEHAQRVDAMLEERGDMPPAGGEFHAEGPMDGGWWYFEVWESEDHARAFYDGRLAPTLSEMGLTQPIPRKLDVQWHSNQPQGR